MRSIDADALAELLKREAEHHEADGLLERSYGVLDAYMDVLQAPTVDVPDKKIGKWIQDENDEGKWYCSECGERTTETIMGMPRFKYCPMCGTCLGGEDDESRGI